MFLVGEPVRSMYAFGNFDISGPKWTEFRGQIDRSGEAIKKFMSWYPTGEFCWVYGECPKLEVEYFMDSAINTVAYIIFKQNGTNVTKYHLLRAVSGPYKD